MKDIVFETPTVQVSFFTDKIYTHVFKGFNISDKPLAITKSNVSCGCMTATLPDKIPVGEFEIKLHLNKIGQEGYFGHFLTLMFSNGQTQLLKINGQLIKK